jgi:hypothetical protein
VEQELDDELRFHLQQQTEENLAAGMTLEDAALVRARRLAGRSRSRRSAGICAE